MHTKDVKRDAERAAEDVSDTMHRTADRAEELFQESWKSLQEKSSDIQENIVTYIKANPVKAVGMAAIAGLLIAQIMKK